jgi:uncharacterized repeat protein (TIGR01451 family)
MQLRGLAQDAYRQYVNVAGMCTAGSARKGHKLPGRPLSGRRHRVSRVRAGWTGLWGLLLLALAGMAQANTCAPAASGGAAPADYQNYCWLDFSGYSDAQAQAGGQPFTFTLPDGSTLNLTLQVSTNRGNPALNAHVVPSWSGSAIGHTGFIGIPGNPVLYESQTGSTVRVVLNNISVTPPPGSGITDTYAIVAADGESTNQGESLQFTTNGSAWSQVAQIPFGTNYPAVSGLNSKTVTETGVAGNVGAFAFASFNNPTVISATLVGTGLQGALFAVRYASVALTAQFSGARANAADQFTYRISTPSGQILGAGTTSGAGAGPFPAASLSTIAAGYPFVVSEVQAAGSVSPIADYAVSLTCTNSSVNSSSTALPSNQAVSSYTFPTLHYGDAINCVFTDTANRANLTIAKSGPPTVGAGSAVKYTLVIGDQGPLAASGALVPDPAVANFSASSVACTAASGGAACPAAAQLTIANLQGPGVAIPTLPNGGTVTLVVSGTAGTANITNTASIGAPPGIINSNPTPTSTVLTTVTPSADVAVSLSFPPSVNAGQPVAGKVLFTNNGPSTASGTAFTLSVPANLAVPPTLAGLPAGSGYSYIPATGVVTLTGMPTSLVAGATLSPISVSYTQPATGTSTVTATVSATTVDPNLANNSATVTIGGADVADVAAKVIFPAHANAGQPVAGTVVFSNNGPSLALATTFSLSVAPNLAAAPTLSGLPAGVTYTYVPTGGVITLTGMPTSLAAGVSLSPIGVTYTQPGSATSTVSAAINSTTIDPIPGNNSATATITGIAVADLTTKLTFPAHVNAGQTVTGTVLFTNGGPSTANGTTFNLSVAPGLSTPPTLTGLPPGATFTYAAATGVITLTGMPTSLTAGASLSPIGVSYTQPPSGTSTVTASIGTTTSLSDPGKTGASVTVTGAAASLMGTVFIDNNQDAIFDAGDSAIAGATVQLSEGTRVVASAMTDAAGVYTFTGLAMGRYSVAVITLPGYLSDTPTPVAVTLAGVVGVVNFGEIPAGAAGALVLTKTSPLVNVSAGQSVPYTITAKNPKSVPIVNSTVTDLMPAGFHFRTGSGSIDGKRLDPAVNGRELTWTHLSFAPGETKTFTLVLTVGAGGGGGDFVNQAMAYNGLTHGLISNVASATVRIIGDPTFDCPDLIGKVFDDANANGVPDPGEKGIAGVRLVTAQGLLVTTDAQGRYHIACPVIPNADLGSNFVVKVDERTLPSGYRLTTDNPETVRLTAGKVSKLNFGATIHRVVRIEVNDAAYEGDALRPQVDARLDALVESLKDQASIVRLAYEAGTESDAQVSARLRALKSAVTVLWKAKDCRYPLRIEEDIVRSGRAPDAGGVAP